MKESVKSPLKEKLIIKKCHICGHLNEASKELERCGQCKKAFLPLNYFLKIHEKLDHEPYKNLFAASHQLDEEDLIHGIYVLW